MLRQVLSAAPQTSLAAALSNCYPPKAAAASDVFQHGDR